LGVKGAEFDVKSLRYRRIVIMTDADVDGAHIRVLLLTFFFRYQRELIEHGYVYIAQPPLYKVSSGSGRARKEEYAFNDSTKDSLIRQMIGTSSNDDSDANDGDNGDTDDVANALSSGRVTVQRFKGLGEMMPKQLWSTTMDPESRSLLKVTMEDATIADQTLSILMGDAVAPRKNFISTNAESLRMTDLDY
jgi:DNA gyrase subunit B